MRSCGVNVLARALMVLLIACFAPACGGDDDGGGDGDADADVDADSDADGDADAYSGTWVQVGCANSENCEDIECLTPDWETYARTIVFQGGGVVLLSVGDLEPTEARLEGNRICNEMPGGDEACFELAECGELLLYCLAPSTCEKLAQEG